MRAGVDHRISSLRSQRGYALLLTFLILVLAATTFYVSTRTSRDEERSRADQTQANELARARDSVIAAAANDANRPGSLSCPDLDDDGSAETGTDCNRLLGQFPYRTYGTRPVKDASGSKLWYAIAPGLLDKLAPLTSWNVNPDSVTPFKVNNVPGFGAVIISPGGVTTDVSGARDEPGEFLESVSGGGGANDNGPPFIDCNELSACNDRIRGIPLAVLFDIPQRRVLAAVEEMLRDFYDDHGYLPHPATFGSEECDGSASPPLGQLPFVDTDGDCNGVILNKNDDPTDGQWVKGNKWFPFVVYRVEEDCVGVGASCNDADLAIGEETGLQVVIAVAGRAHADQSRGSSADVSDYLDSTVNTDGNTRVFDDGLPTLTDNDTLRGFKLE